MVSTDQAVDLFRPGTDIISPLVRFLVNAGFSLHDRAVAPIAAPEVSRPRSGRIEQKYCVPEEVASNAVRLASAFLSRDRHGANGGTQRVTSLYFDSPSLTFLRWHRDRQPTRFKLRVRAYGEAQLEGCFAEVKRKVDGSGQKRRAHLPAGALDRLLAGDPSLLETLEGADAAALREFLWQMLTFRAAPKVLISCDRESLRGDFPGDETAVTVDRGLVCQPARTLRGEAGAWRAIPLPLASSTAPVVLELKYGRQAPAWMATLVRQLAPWRVSFSKYMTAMTRLDQWEIR